jgi:hypothetical protein
MPPFETHITREFFSIRSPFAPSKPSLPADFLTESSNHNHENDCNISIRSRKRTLEAALPDHARGLGTYGTSTVLEGSFFIDFERLRFFV